MSAVSDFIGELFLARDVAHSVHLSSRSFSKHMALGAFYDEVVELADKFAEAYQGRKGIIGAISLRSARETQIIPFLEKSLDYIETERFNIADKADTALQNIIDEIVALYLTTLYKLKFLA